MSIQTEMIKMLFQLQKILESKKMVILQSFDLDFRGTILSTDSNPIQEPNPVSQIFSWQSFNLLQSFKSKSDCSNSNVQLKYLSSSIAFLAKAEILSKTLRSRGWKKGLYNERISTYDWKLDTNKDLKKD